MSKCFVVHCSYNLTKNRIVFPDTDESKFYFRQNQLDCPYLYILMQMVLKMQVKDYLLLDQNRSVRRQRYLPYNVFKFLDWKIIWGIHVCAYTADQVQLL